MHITRTTLTEGITHLEDLDVQAFINAVSNLSKMQATEKLDGANLWFGIDQDGKLYTSRAGKSKSAENVYSEEDYPYHSANNGFRATLAALKAKETEIKQILQPGSTIEIEVLFGRQPNAVTYGANGKNYIAFLRGVEGTPDVLVDQLANSLNNQTVKVNVKTVDSTDGVNLDLEPTELTFQFVGVQKLDAAHLKKVDVTKQLAALKKFLERPAGLEGSEITNFQLATASLGSIPKEVRPAAKEAKQRLLATIMGDFKLPIKRELLDRFVAQIKSPLAAADMSPDEDIGIEGVVLKEPGTENQIKLVDKDTFTTINQFNYAVRSAIGGMIKTTDSEAPAESRGGLLGQLKIMIADLLGNRELARTLGAKKIFQSLKGKTPEDTLKNVVGELNGAHDYTGTKQKIVAMINETMSKLAIMLQDFKAHKDSFHLKLKSGKTMGLSPEIIRRTLVSFAEAKRDLDEMKAKIQKSTSMNQLAAILYGKVAKAVHQTDEAEPVTEGLLTEKRHYVDKTLYQDKDAWTILNIYFAILMIACIIYKSDDKLGIKALRDKAHCGLKAWSKEMSPLNFWGYIIWRCGQPAAKKLMMHKAAADLYRVVRRIPANTWRFMHLDLSYGKERVVDWESHRKIVRVLQQLPGVNTDRVNSLLDGAFRYENLTFDEKVKLLGKLYYYVMQFIPNTPLLFRLRTIQSELLLNADAKDYQLMSEMKLLRSVAAIQEDDASVPAGGTDAGAGPSATTAAAIANYQSPVGKQKNLIRRKRTDWRPVKFPNPHKVETK